MIPKECKRLAEVDFPIAGVSANSAGEKYAGKGYPSMLHMWWARRPLGACRAMLLGLLLPDPCDPHCPEDFKKNARGILACTHGTPGQKDEDLRKALLRFMASFADWDVSTHPVFLEVSRGLVKAAYPEETPLVVDPFAGGGSIPLEALRIGCETFASDLNPVACLILKVMLEDIPRYGPKLAEELRRVGKEIKEKAEEELVEFYPKDPDGAMPIAYLWARTVRCESPNCGAEIPLARSFWLCKKANRKRALRYKVIKPKSGPPFVDFEVFEPKAIKEVPSGTVTRAKATCLCCNIVLPPERVRTQLAEQSGGADSILDEKGSRTGGARMMAVVTLHPGVQGRHYRLSSERDYQAVWKAQERLKEIIDEWEYGDQIGFCPVPDESTPSGGGSGAGRAFSVQKYGMMSFGDLFTSRQKVGASAFTRLVADSSRYDETRYRKNVLGCALSRLTMSGMSCTRWNASAEKMQHTFGRQALPIVWDFAEVVPLADAPGNWKSGYELVANVIDATSCLLSVGQCEPADACEHPLGDESTDVWFTDPPYYDAIPYSELSDFFFVWLKRALPRTAILRDPFDIKNPLTPKVQEAVQDETKTYNGHPKDRIFFERSMARAFAEGRRLLRENGIGCVVFAHKTTEGWEALLSGMIQGGLTITGSWPVATELGSRLRARESAALATSVHLVCRPRPEDAPVGDWADVLRELPKRVGDWMERLQDEGIRGADLVFACIGPALEIFSRYPRVEAADGSEVKLAEYLEKVWEVVGRTALEQVLGTAEAKARNGAAGAVEEDARLTALFLWTLQTTSGHNGNDEKAEKVSDGEEEDTSRGKSKGFSLVFDVVRRFAQPLGIELPKWEGRVIETKKGVVRLMAVSERAEQLFGEGGTNAVADWIENDPSKNLQLVLFPEMEKDRAPKVRGRGRRRKTALDTSAVEFQNELEATTLDRVHAAMLLQAGGQANALRELIQAEQDRGPDFLRLANALSALYPAGSEEKRLLDAMLLAVPR